MKKITCVCCFTLLVLATTFSRADESLRSNSLRGESLHQELSSDSSTVAEQASIIDSLRTELAQLTGRKLSESEQRTRIALLQELKVASTIHRQINRVPISRDEKKKVEPSESDSFVLAKIHVSPNSQEAEVTFEQGEGVNDRVKNILEFLKARPAGAFRDYRLISRHSTNELATDALAATRKAYDAQKERQQQMLAYISQRNKTLASLKSTCRR